MRKKTARAMKEARLARQQQEQEQKKVLFVKDHLNPTLGDTQEEIDYLQRLLDNHGGCDVIRRYICDAALVVDIAHKVAHSRKDGVTEKVLVQFLDEVGNAAVEIATDWQMSLRVSVVLFGLAAVTARQAVRRKAAVQDQLAAMPCNEAVN